MFAGPGRAAPTSTATFTTSTTPTVRINEVLATNTRIATGANTFSDIIELHNAGAVAVDVSGQSLTDASVPPIRYVFPTGTSIAAGGFLVVYADTNTMAAGLHTGFALDAEGDEVHLYDTVARGGVELDRIVFGFQIPDYSIARTGPGANLWALTIPTPGLANPAAAALADVAAVKINEWAGKITFRLDHDLIELFNPNAGPVALGGTGLTDSDDANRRDRDHFFQFPGLSFIGGNGYLPLYGADFVFGLDGDSETITISGENNERIDRVTLLRQWVDQASGRSPDGSATIVDLPVPTPGFSNRAVLPAAHTALLNYLRITEIMYQPVAPSGSSDYEFIELQNIGPVPLELGGVRFTNGLDYTFPAGTTLAAGAFVAVVNDRSSFLSRYPSSTSFMAPGGFNGSLDNSGESLALTLPPPWDVHVLRFRFEPGWFASASGGGHSIVAAAPSSSSAQDWREVANWRASAAVNGSPGRADPASSSGEAAGGAARLINLSILTEVVSAGDAFTMGYVVGSSGTAERKALLVRAAGPSLAQLNVAGVLADPRMEFFAGTTWTGENDNWSGTSALNAAFVAVGAFPYASPTSLDAAALVAVAPGDNSVRVSAAGSGTGAVIAELYDSTPASGVSASTLRLINVSVLKHLGAGLTAGFVVGGNGARTVLIRAVGPTLAAAPFNVPGAVADPELALFSGSTMVGNDDWAGTPTLTAAFAQVGAFALPGGSRDAAMLATLKPGQYTVRVSGVGGTTGVALVEVYEVP